MFDWLRNSLIARGGLAMASITLIALLNIFASVIVADRAQGDAAAINIAGSLRLHATRLGYLLQKNEQDISLSGLQQQAAVISSKLHSNDLTRVLQYHREDEVYALYSQIVSSWHNQIEPAFYDKSLSRDGLRTFYDAYLESLVQNADKMVLRLQIDSEDKIRFLLAIQGASMFLTIIVIFVAMYKLNTSIVTPLRKLLNAAERIRAGDFSVALEHEMDDELGQLADTFNQMSQELNRMYTDLEKKVNDKTAELMRSNQSLQLMYNAARRLSVLPYSNKALGEITLELMRTTGVKHISVCLDDRNNENGMTPLFFTDTEADERCIESNCDDCYLHSVRQANFGIDIKDPAFPIRLNRKRYGILFVEPLPGHVLAPWQIDLFNAISDTIATALSLERKAENESRLMLAEERAAIARDLHDSLAQSLSYLKFQIGRWKMLQEKNAPRQQVDDVVDDIRDGLNGAYKQLRELLTTFRLKISDPGLEPALRGTVAEFSQRGDVDVQLDYGLRDTKLTPNEEIHLLQIVREALSNILKHAQANTVLVSLSITPDQIIQLCVEDDGVGLPKNTQKQHHYGLSIMKERASYLNAELQLSESPMGGARVYLEYKHEDSSIVPSQVSYV
jgi:two-component system nitrate/nitrite sensor histidine kinase NarX